MLVMNYIQMLIRIRPFSGGHTEYMPLIFEPRHFKTRGAGLIPLPQTGLRSTPGFYGTLKKAQRI